MPQNDASLAVYAPVTRQNDASLAIYNGMYLHLALYGGGAEGFHILCGGT